MINILLEHMNVQWSRKIKTKESRMVFERILHKNRTY